MKSLSYVLSIGCCILFTLYSAHSFAAAGEEPITLNQVITLVLEHNPVLQAAEFDSRASAARIRQATQTTPLKAGIELENFAGSGSTSGTDALEATLRLSRVLQLGGKTQLRNNLARQEAVLLGNEQDAQRLGLLAESAQRFLDVVAGQERIIIARDTEALAQRTLDIVDHRVQVGKTPTAERSRAAIRLARAELELSGLTSELESARLLLTSSWGDTQVSFSNAEADLYVLPQVIPFETLEAHLERNPELVQLATAQRIGEARERLARASRRPDIELAGGIRYLNEPDDTALVFSASMPLGSTRRAVPAIDETHALMLREPLAYQDRRLTLYTTLFSLHQQLVQTRTKVMTLTERVIPAAVQALREYERGYSAGRYSWLELVDAQRVLLEARREALDMAAEHHRFHIEIDRLTGGIEITGGKS